MKAIPLTKGQIAWVDDEDFEWLNQWKWCAQYSKNTDSHYAVRSGSMVKGKPGPTLLMHRVVMAAPKDVKVDHRDHDTLMNCRHNLRLATLSQNQHNRTKQRNNTSGFKGVTWHGIRNKWCAQIWLGNRKTYLGLFTDKIEAAKAYNKAALQFHEEFAVLNPI